MGFLLFVALNIIAFHFYCRWSPKQQRERQKAFLLRLNRRYYPDASLPAKPPLATTIAAVPQMWVQIEYDNDLKTIVLALYRDLDDNPSHPHTHRVVIVKLKRAGRLVRAVNQFVGTRQGLVYANRWQAEEIWSEHKARAKLVPLTGISV